MAAQGKEISNSVSINPCVKIGSDHAEAGSICICFSIGCWKYIHSLINRDRFFIRIDNTIKGETMKMHLRLPLQVFKSKNTDETLSRIGFHAIGI